MQNAAGAPTAQNLPLDGAAGEQPGRSTIVIDGGVATGPTEAQTARRSGSAATRAGSGTRAARAAQSTQSNPGADAGTSGLSFAGVLRSERIKLTSLRSIKVTLLITLVVGLGLSAMIALVFTIDPGMEAQLSTATGAQFFLLTVTAFTTPFLALVFGVLGVFAISSEYSSGMILSTLAAVPKRTPVFVAKGLVLALISGVTALVLMAGGAGIAVLLAPQTAAQLGSLTVISGMLGGVAYLVLISLLAFGVSGLLRSTAGGISVITGLIFVLPIALQMLALTNWDWVPAVAPYLPSSLGSTLSFGISSDSPMTQGMPAEGPTFWVALLAMVLWAAVAVIPAAIAFKRRDAK